MLALGQAARQAAQCALALATTGQKNHALRAMAADIRRHAGEIATANAVDVAAAKKPRT